MITFNVKLLLPSIPNYIIAESNPVQRQDGFSEAPKFGIEELTDEQLRALGAEWTEELVRRARHKRTGAQR